MTAALTANASGLDALVVEKSAHFGGSTALSGGGIWVPGAPRSAGRATSPIRTALSSICSRSPTVWSARLAYGSTSSRRRRCWSSSKDSRRGWNSSGSPATPTTTRNCPAAPNSAARSTCRPIDLRKLGHDEQTLLKPLALAPKGIWLGPKELRILLSDPAVVGRQGRAAEADRADGQGEGVRRADGGDRAVAGGSAAAGDEGARYPAVAGLADGRIAHRRRRIGDRGAGGARRHKRSGSARAAG